MLRIGTVAAAVVLASGAHPAAGQLAPVRRPAGVAARVPAGRAPGGTAVRLPAGPVWAPAEASEAPLIYFRQTFSLSADPVSAALRVTAGGAVTVYVDGQSVLSSRRGAEQSVSIGEMLSRGRHVLAFECVRRGDGDGLTFVLTLTMPDGRVLKVTSNGDERVAWRRFEGWEQPAFADAGWALSQPVAVPVQPARVTAVAPPRAGTPDFTDPVAPAPRIPAAADAPMDRSRLVRVWDLAAGGRPGDPDASRPRVTGDRMILGANVPYPEDLPAIASAGFTLFQSDRGRGSDERRAEADLREVRARGLDWGLAPHFAAPPASQAGSDRYTPVRCLEHDRTIAAYSPWDPGLVRSASAALSSLAERYDHPAGASAVTLGLYGDAGVAGMFAGGRTGAQHDHAGWWCGDELAREDFAGAMVARHHDLDGVNEAWGTHYRSRSDIAYPTAPPASSRRHWLDFVEWYRGAIGRVASSVCREARRSFSSTPILLPVGFADDDPRYGCDPADLASVAAHSGVSVRATVSGLHPAAENQAGMYGRIASAARFYGAGLWTEPPGKLTAPELTSRLFETISQGASGLFDTAANVRANREVYYRQARHLRIDAPVVDVAMYYPGTSMALRPDVPYPPTFLKGCTEIRDVLNYDIVDERIVRDGALRRYRILVMWEGTVSEQATLDRIRDWVEAGGVLVAYDFGKIESVEGDTSWFRSVFGYAGRMRPAVTEERFIASDAGKSLARYRIYVADRQSAGFLAGDWQRPPSGSAPGRWAGRSSRLRLPVAPGRAYVLTIRASAALDEGGYPASVFVNGRRLGSLTPGSGLTTLPVPANCLAGRTTATVTVANRAGSPAPTQRAGEREIGTLVEYVEMDATMATADAPDPGPPAGRLEAGVDLERLKTEWAVRLGRGWTVYFPATRAQLHAYCEVVRFLTYHLTELDPTAKDAIAIDDRWDGVLATLMTGRAVFYNPGQEPYERRITMPSAAMEPGRSARRIRTAAYDVSVDAGDMAVVSFGPPRPELLLQCEKFTDLGALRPQEGALYSPGTGATHVLVPVGRAIATRFDCATPGTYTVFVRAARRGALARSVVAVDGRPLDPTAPEGPRRPGVETMRVGSVSLSRGVHTLTLSPVRGQDVRADFVVLTTEPTIAGYGFAVR